MTLVKADIQAIDEDDEVVDTVEIQFNPASMQLQFANTTDGGAARARQTQQYNGTGSTTLSLDLEFDTADLEDGGEPVDVRKETKKVSQFVLPGGTGSKKAPPRARFRWGTFELTGVMSSLTEDLSFFSSGGVPLRAKLTIQIKEQDTRYTARPTEAGANPPAEAPPSGDGGGDGDGGGAIDSAAEALDGETPADFLARNGLAPDAWRALGGALDALADGVELEAGVAIGFDSTLSIGAGIGVTAGFQAGLGVDAAAAVGLGASVSSGVSAKSAPARALSAAGGVTAAIEAAAVQETGGTAASARASFGMSEPSSAASGPSGGAAAKAPLTAGGAGRIDPPGVALPRERPPQADRRATSFGRGVPLREQTVVPGSAADRYVVVGRPSAPVSVALPGRSIEAPWKRLPRVTSTAAGDRHSASESPCACRGCDPRNGSR